ncbi:MAG: hypothetical protein HY703_05045, partial [Gemmatimonadetes bacterium]|nr:hypothetical protein [Gemmatimonadota bacterium]
LHFLALLISRYFIAVGPPALEPAASRAEPAPEPHGLEVYRIVPSAVHTLPAALAPVRAGPRQAQERPPPVPRAGAEGPAGQPEGRAAPRALSPAERLRPRVHDRRLWVLPHELEPPAKTDEELMRERVYGRIDELNDSLRAELEAQRRGTDWTIKGKDGKRWGISPEGIHLGGITLPAPSFGAPPGRRDEINDRLREWGEIQQQSDQARIRDRFDERVKAIRERKDREREEKKKEGS